MTMMKIQTYMFSLFVMHSACLGSKRNNEDKEVCYDEIGCFPMTKPWYDSKLRPVEAPSPPKEVDTKIYLKSEKNLLNANATLKSQAMSTFNSSQLTIFIIHGFDSSGRVPWVQAMSEALLQNTDANIMVVDWGRGSSGVTYRQACGNIRLVAREVVHLITSLKLDPSLVYIIGHSLGAQCAGLIGFELGGLISRITALDAAQPFFEGYDKRVRLDKSDAKFVDAIHTDSQIALLIGFGYISPFGHVDTYMNGGFMQPGCSGSLKEAYKLLNATKFVDKLIDTVQLGIYSECDHVRSHDILIEAIINSKPGDCKFLGYKVSARTITDNVINVLIGGHFPSILSRSCNRTNCIVVGLDTPRYPARGLFLTMTRAMPPFCIRELGFKNTTEKAAKKP